MFSQDQNQKRKAPEPDGWDLNEPMDQGVNVSEIIPVPDLSESKKPLIEILEKYNYKGDLEFAANMIQQAVDSSTSTNGACRVLRSLNFHVGEILYELLLTHFLEIKFPELTIETLINEIQCADQPLLKFISDSKYKVNQQPFIHYLKKYNQDYFLIRFKNYNIIKIFKILRDVANKYYSYEIIPKLDVSMEDLLKSVEMWFKINPVLLIKCLTRFKNSEFLLFCRQDLGTLLNPTVILPKALETILAHEQEIIKWTAPRVYENPAPSLILNDPKQKIQRAVSSNPNIIFNEANYEAICDAFISAQSENEMCEILSSDWKKVYRSWVQLNLNFWELKFKYQWKYDDICIAIRYYNLPLDDFVARFTYGLSVDSFTKYLLFKKTLYDFVRFQNFPITHFLFLMRFAYDKNGEKITSRYISIIHNLNIAKSTAINIIPKLFGAPLDKLLSCIDSFSDDEFEDFCKQDLGTFLQPSPIASDQLKVLLSREKHDPKFFAQAKKAPTEYKIHLSGPERFEC